MERQCGIDTLCILIRNVATKCFTELGMTQEMIDQSQIRIETFGSYRMQTTNQNGDVDLLIIGPRSLMRNIFMEALEKEFVQTKDMNHVCYIADAYVPLLKCTLHKMEFDIVYAQLVTPIVNGIQIEEDQVLAFMDEKSILSLNGYRVTMKLLSLLSNNNNNHLDLYRKALLFLKYWAKQRCIYGNKYGFLGGIQLSILLLKILLLKKLTIKKDVDLINEFFRIYSTWNWDTQSVFLVSIPEHHPLAFIPPLVYDPSRPQPMVILTPCYPHMNSSFNINEQNRTRIIKEIQRAHLFLEKDSNMEMVSTSFGFFQEYKHFLQFTISADTALEFHKWSGWCEAKMRLLSHHIGQHLENLQLDLLPISFPVSENKISFFFGIHVAQTKKRKRDDEKKDKKKIINLSIPIQKFKSLIENYKDRTSSQNYSIVHLKKSNLPSFLIL